jgi:hypothetical protein
MAVNYLDKIPEKTKVAGPSRMISSNVSGPVRRKDTDNSPPRVLTRNAVLSVLSSRAAQMADATTPVPQEYVSFSTPLS